MQKIERTEVHSRLAELLIADRFDEIGTVPGIRIFKRRNPEWSNHFRCAEYVFGSRLGEPWALDEVPKDFWDNGIEFLCRKGFNLVEEPVAGDIIAYAVVDLIERYITDEAISAYHRARLESRHRTPPYFVHFGILTGEGRIISKFGPGHVYLHKVNSVPYHFGSEIYFFRKNRTETGCCSFLN